MSLCLDFFLYQLSTECKSAWHWREAPHEAVWEGCLRLSRACEPSASWPASAAARRQLLAHASLTAGMDELRVIATPGLQTL
eukprot:365114-Chlamydomonas_euryale.AAC.2